MTEELETIDVVSIKFRNRGKAYFFDPAGYDPAEGEKVVVQTAKGLELGTVVRKAHPVSAEHAVQPLRPVVRTATAEDLQIEDRCRTREREAYLVGRQKIADHGLEMKLVDVECSFEGNRILFFFSSEGRVDFRDLVRDLAGVFHTRIELRQIGVRDEARMLGGLGICGRPFCCGTFMEEFAPVSTKMAKIQSMSLNPAKISGCCGRLMCCLRYEQEAYEELVKNVPKNGAFVETPDGYGNVTQINVLRQTVKVKLDGPGDDAFHTYDADEVAAIPGGRPRDGSQPPHILVLKPKKPKEPEEEKDRGWELPDRLITTAEEREARTVRQELDRRTGGQGSRGEKRQGDPGSRNNRRKKNGQTRREGAEKNESNAGEKKNSAPRQQGKNRSGRNTQQSRTQQQGKQENGGQKQERRQGDPERKNAASQKQENRQNAGEQKGAKEQTAEGGASGRRRPRYNKRRHSTKPKSGGEQTAQQGE